MKKFVYHIFGILLLIGCGKNGDPPVPGTASLVFPEENSECTTGISVNDDQSQVTFQWGASTNTDSYTLRVVNLNTNSPQSISTAATSASVSIAKGTPFSWSVTSSNSSSNQVGTSETWLFYNAGAQTSYAPFPAQLVSPVSGSTVQRDIANEVLLSWTGADVDNDLDNFQILFSDQNPPTTEVGTTTPSVMELSVTVNADTVYYWKVITTDLEGNTSDSGVFEFRVF